jgi:hypothetical protein
VVETNRKETAMEINKIKKAAEIATARTNDKRWNAAIDKAVKGVESGKWIITELAHSVAITTESGETYFANGSCQCRAYALNTPCKHRALARLIEIAATIKEAPEASTREQLISDIKANTNPIELSAWLQRSAGVTRIDSRWLHIDTLKAIHQAVAA